MSFIVLFVIGICHIIYTISEKNIVKRLHAGHLSMEDTINRAKNIVYWQRMNKQIEQLITTCDACNTYKQY